MKPKASKVALPLKIIMALCRNPLGHNTLSVKLGLEKQQGILSCITQIIEVEEVEERKEAELEE